MSNFFDKFSDEAAAMHNMLQESCQVYINMKVVCFSGLNYGEKSKERS